MAHEAFISVKGPQPAHGGTAKGVARDKTPPPTRHNLLNSILMSVNRDTTGGISAGAPLLLSPHLSMVATSCAGLRPRPKPVAQSQAPAWLPPGATLSRASAAHRAHRASSAPYQRPGSHTGKPSTSPTVSPIELLLQSHYHAAHARSNSPPPAHPHTTRWPSPPPAPNFSGYTPAATAAWPPCGMMDDSAGTKRCGDVQNQQMRNRVPAGNGRAEPVNRPALSSITNTLPIEGVNNSSGLLGAMGSKQLQSPSSLGPLESLVREALVVRSSRDTFASVSMDNGRGQSWERRATSGAAAGRHGASAGTQGSEGPGSWLARLAEPPAGTAPSYMPQASPNRTSSSVGPVHLHRPCAVPAQLLQRGDLGDDHEELLPLPLGEVGGGAWGQAGARDGGGGATLRLVASPHKAPQRAGGADRYAPAAEGGDGSAASVPQMQQQYQQRLTQQQQQEQELDDREASVDISALAQGDAELGWRIAAARAAARKPAPAATGRSGQPGQAASDGRMRAHGSDTTRYSAFDADASAIAGQLLQEAQQLGTEHSPLSEGMMSTLFGARAPGWSEDAGAKAAGPMARSGRGSLQRSHAQRSNGSLTPAQPLFPAAPVSRPAPDLLGGFSPSPRRPNAAALGGLRAGDVHADMGSLSGAGGAGPGAGVRLPQWDTPPGQATGSSGSSDASPATQAMRAFLGRCGVDDVPSSRSRSNMPKPSALHPSLADTASSSRWAPEITAGVEGPRQVQGASARPQAQQRPGASGGSYAARHLLSKAWTGWKHRVALRRLLSYCERTRNERRLVQAFGAWHDEVLAQQMHRTSTLAAHDAARSVLLQRAAWTAWSALTQQAAARRAHILAAAFRTRCASLTGHALRGWVKHWAQQASVRVLRQHRARATARRCLLAWQQLAAQHAEAVKQWTGRPGGGVRGGAGGKGGGESASSAAGWEQQQQQRRLQPLQPLQQNHQGNSGHWQQQQQPQRQGGRGSGTEPYSGALYGVVAGQGGSGQEVRAPASAFGGTWTPGGSSHSGAWQSELTFASSSAKDAMDRSNGALGAHAQSSVAQHDHADGGVTLRHWQGQRTGSGWSNDVLDGQHDSGSGVTGTQDASAASVGGSGAGSGPGLGAGSWRRHRSPQQESLETWLPSGWEALQVAHESRFSAAALVAVEAGQGHMQQGPWSGQGGSRRDGQAEGQWEGLDAEESMEDAVADELAASYGRDVHRLLRLRHCFRTWLALADQAVQVMRTQQDLKAATLDELRADAVQREAADLLAAHRYLAPAWHAWRLAVAEAAERRTAGLQEDQEAAEDGNGAEGYVGASAPSASVWSSGSSPSWQPWSAAPHADAALITAVEVTQSMSSTSSSSASGSNREGDSGAAGPARAAGWAQERERLEPEALSGFNSGRSAFHPSGGFLPLPESSFDGAGSLEDAPGAPASPLDLASLRAQYRQQQQSGRQDAPLPAPLASSQSQPQASSSSDASPAVYPRDGTLPRSVSAGGFTDSHLGSGTPPGSHATTPPAVASSGGAVSHRRLTRTGTPPSTAAAVTELPPDELLQLLESDVEWYVNRGLTTTPSPGQQQAAGVPLAWAEAGPSEAAEAVVQEPYGGGEQGEELLVGQHWENAGEQYDGDGGCGVEGEGEGEGEGEQGGWSEVPPGEGVRGWELTADEAEGDAGTSASGWAGYDAEGRSEGLGGGEQGVAVGGGSEELIVDAWSHEGPYAASPMKSEDGLPYKCFTALPGGMLRLRGGRWFPADDVDHR